MQTNLKETVFLTTFLGNGFTNWKTNQNTHLGFALDAIVAIPQARSFLYLKLPIISSEQKHFLSILSVKCPGQMSFLWIWWQLAAYLFYYVIRNDLSRQERQYKTLWIYTRF